MLAAKGMHKQFGAVHVLRGVDFEAPSGQITALLGDNGAGKSTLIKCIAGTLAPDSGEIYLDGALQHSRPAAASHPAGAGDRVGAERRVLCL